MLRPTARHTRSRQTLRRGLTGYAMLAPSMIGILGFLLAPVLIVIIVSLFDWKLLGTPRFVGLKNYAKLFGDEGVGHSLLVTVGYVLICVPGTTILSLLLATLVNRKLKGMKYFRALLVIPWMAAPVALGLVWGWIFDPARGAINSFLGLVGIAGPSWLSTPELALPSVAAVHVWQFAGYNMLFFLAGLQNIPESLREASALDGASAVRHFFTITLPLLRPTLLFVLITNVIGSFQAFDTIYVMTEGGPGDSTEVITYHIYHQAFERFDFGYSSTISVALFVIILAVSLAQFAYFERRTTYDVS
ncbi:carbohydrate ABC transporter permease [Microlunatus parietis]|uniref:Multiple sugar transport system permease protein/sn-glycerol 3-phosphate transport system permease protein n=1 Tax=Microlunatus parietis TaxID=682979 RepID=A0A7Y9LDI4_9ACTN|nr:sugar ABC transporter permease [Microlunatus parietis]NYE72825.1 multiple sugar transport system permease protein/sn-glycerol 3-phosphate transport system permease protein [Microlunatus parietis]